MVLSHSCDGCRNRNAEMSVTSRMLTVKLTNFMHSKYSRRNSILKVIAEQQHYNLSYFVGSLKSDSRSEVQHASYQNLINQSKTRVNSLLSSMF